MPLQTYIGTFTFKNSGSDGLKRTYIAMVEPAYAGLISDHDRIKVDKTWSFMTLEAGHDAMVIAPQELAALLTSL